MKVEITDAQSLAELDNILMMVSFARRYGGYDHKFASNVVKKLNAARDAYIEEFNRQRELFEKDG